MDRARDERDVDTLMGQFHEYLTKKQLKSTRQRDIIARQFFAAEGHLSIEELLALAREENPRIGYATVYRTLKLLTERGRFGTLPDIARVYRDLVDVRMGRVRGRITSAKKLDAKYAPEGKHVFFCDEVYAKAQGDFDKWLQEHGYPSSSHAGIPDTSTMLYLGGDKGWVRKELVATAEGDPVPPPGQRGRGRGPADPNAPPRKNNGITGDARRSTAARRHT